MVHAYGPSFTVLLFSPAHAAKPKLHICSVDDDSLSDSTALRVEPEEFCQTAAAITEKKRSTLVNRNAWIYQ